jgi:hypothetical protein
LQKTKQLSQKEIMEGSIIHRKSNWGSSRLELLVENATCSPTSEQQVLSSRGNSKDEYTYGWYSSSVGNK